MKLPIVVAIVFPLVSVPAFARIGETPDQLQQRYGSPTKKAFDSDGSGISVYRSDKFNEIRVTFLKGVSRLEVFKYINAEPIPKPLIEMVHAENPGQNVHEHERGIFKEIEVQPWDTGQSMSKASEEPSGRETTYTGSVKLRNDEGRYAVLIDHGTVVELRNWEEFHLKAGRTYSVTLLQQPSVDMGTRLGVVSKREHVDWDDCVADAGSNGIQQLMRITSGDKVVFDRSICDVHHVKMEWRSVSVAYELYAPASDAEMYCWNHFPHFHDFALGGCDMSDNSPKTTQIYVCPKCVAACNQYTRQHPEKHK